MRTCNASIPACKWRCCSFCSPCEWHFEESGLFMALRLWDVCQVIMIHMRNVKREDLTTQLIRKMAPPLGLCILYNVPLVPPFLILWRRRPSQSRLFPLNPRSSGLPFVTSISFSKSDPKFCKMKCGYSFANTTTHPTSKLRSSTS